MPKIEFRAKMQEIEDFDGNVVERRVKVPRLQAHHYDNDGRRAMGEPLRGGSQMAQRIYCAWLDRKVRQAGIVPGAFLDLAALPPSVTVDTGGFLAAVIIHLED